MKDYGMISNDESLHEDETLDRLLKLMTHHDLSLEEAMQELNLSEQDKRKYRSMGLIRIDVYVRKNPADSSYH